MDNSISEVASHPLSSSFQASSGHVYSCKWAWCRLTFSDNALLVQHVIHEHARRSIPVRRRDIAIVRRIEEGSGDSLHMSSLVKGVYAPIAGGSSQSLGTPGSVQGSVSKQPNEISSPLPSPPISSPSIDPSYLHGKHGSGSDEPERPKEAQTGNKKRTSSQSIPTFASFNFSSSTPSPISIPASPSFSSLVSKTRQSNFDVPKHELATQDQALRSQSHPLSQSTSTESSATSQASVVKQLTQSPLDSDSDSDEDSARGVQKATEQSNKLSPKASPDDADENNLYEEELSWGSSEFQENHQKLADMESEDLNIESQETGLAFTNFESMFEPPSQLQRNSFPIHNHAHHHHRPELPQLSHMQTQPPSSAPLLLSTPAPLASPTFAVSTPLRQNWYQPVPRRKSGQMVQDAVLISTATPRLKSTEEYSPAPKSRSPTKKKSVFRSGTLHITPVIAESLKRKEEERSQRTHVDLKEMQPNLSANLDNSQDYMDMDHSYEDFSYPPLQTQAPYESQSMSQF